MEANQSTKDQRRRGFLLAQEVEFINWILRPAWEDLLTNSRKPRSEKKQTSESKNDVFLNDEKGGFIHNARAYDIFSRDTEVTRRGTGRLQ